MASTASIFSRNQKEIEEEIGIWKTGRIMPQDQNSGGFYLALFRKGQDTLEAPLDVEVTAQEVAEAEKEAALLEEGGELTEEKPVAETAQGNGQDRNHAAPKKDKKNGYQVQSEAKFIPLQNELWDEIKSDFGVSDAFPRDQLFVATDKNKTIYLVTPAIADFLRNDAKEAIKLINFGTTIFQKSRAEANTPNSYRVSQSGIRFLYPFMTRNIVKVTFDELRYFLNCQGSVSDEDMRKEASIDAAKFLALHKNSYCLAYDPQKPGEDTELFMVSRMEHSVVVMVPKEDVAGLKIKFKLT